MAAKPHSNLTQQQLLEVLLLNQKTGIFTWKRRANMRSQWNSQYAEMPAGSIVEGRLQICINKTKYKAHRLVWLYHYGVWPLRDIDHINGDPLDNRVENLREATLAENSQNKKVRCDSSSGLKGASYCSKRKKYESRIKINGKHLSLGRFNTAKEAHDIYCIAAKKYFGEFARTA